MIVTAAVRADLLRFRIAAASFTEAFDNISPNLGCQQLTLSASRVWFFSDVVPIVMSSRAGHTSRLKKYQNQFILLVSDQVRDIIASSVGHSIMELNASSQLKPPFGKVTQKFNYHANIYILHVLAIR